MPITNVGAASKQQHVSEAIAIVERTAAGLTGVPLALGEDNFLQCFDERTVVGLPDANREQAAQLAKRLGLRPLHKAIDDVSVIQVGCRFNAGLINREIPKVPNWDSAIDSRLLVEVIGALGQVSSPSETLIGELRAQRIWKGSDGSNHTLGELRLPARDKVRRSSQVLVSEELVGKPDASDPVYATLRDRMQVDVLDTTEEAVLACENPPDRRSDRQQLITELADCDHFSKHQLARLQQSVFVLCRDGRLRLPSDALLAQERLPVGLDERRVDDDLRGDRRVRRVLDRLGSLELPQPSDLADAALEISRLPVAKVIEHDPGRVLWEHLARFHDRYPRETLVELSSIRWLAPSATASRHKPNECFDPQLRFAAHAFPVLQGIASPAQSFREALGIRATLATMDCVSLARTAAEEGVELSAGYFTYINARCAHDDDQRQLSELRNLPIIPLSTGPATPSALVRPSALVSRPRAKVWGHLRELVPDQLVSDYPNLRVAWAIDIDTEVPWFEHRRVLTELAERDEFLDEDRALASQRLRSLAEMNLSDHEIETFCRNGYLLTSLGLNAVASALRSDMSPPVVDRLKAHLPIVEESSDTRRLIERLGIQSLRLAIALKLIIEGKSSSNTRWADALRAQSLNVLRFLKASGTRLDADLLEAWPPVVRSVAGMQVVASRDGEILDKWEADAHLAYETTGLALYISGTLLDSYAVVDAIASEFGIESGKKTLLKGILDSATPQEASKQLDWENVPPLTSGESEYLYQHEETSVAFADSASVNEAVDELEDGGANSPRSQVRETESEELQTDVGPAESNHGQSDDGDQTPPSSEATATHAAANGESTATDLSPSADRDSSQTPQTGRPRSPRGATDAAFLESEGIQAVRDDDDEPPEVNYVPDRAANEEPSGSDGLRICLSFFDVSRGFLPVAPNHLDWLTTGVSLQEVEIFGEVTEAHADDHKHIQLEQGVSLFHSREVVPGTVMRLHPSKPGRIEVEVRKEPHWVDGVWMLELDESGELTRLRLDDVELQWETDDLFYKAERRLDDIEALMAEGRESAVQLIIKAFKTRPGQGLTVDEVWGLVSISRLFASSTISQTLSYQSGLFVNQDGLWFQEGDTLRRGRSRSPARSAVPKSPRNRSQGSEAKKLARKLGQLLDRLDGDTIRDIVQLLGIEALLRDDQFAQACARYTETNDPELLEALMKEMRDDRGLAIHAIDHLESLSTASLQQQLSLIELVRAEGNAAAVERAAVLQTRIDALNGNESVEALEAAETLLLEQTNNDSIAPRLWDVVASVWAERDAGDPMEAPVAWVERLAKTEDLHRRATRSSAPTNLALETRTDTIGWLSTQLPGDLYDQPDLQQLRLLLDLLVGRSSEIVLDGLHQLAVLYGHTPGGEGDAALSYALVVAYAKKAGVQSAIVHRSKKRLASGQFDSAGGRARHFADVWLNMARLGSDALGAVGFRPGQPTYQ